MSFCFSYYLYAFLWDQALQITQIKILIAITLRPCIDNKGPHKIKVQKRSKEIGKIIHVTSVQVQP